jgi:YHS domain-containing protein
MGGIYTEWRFKGFKGVQGFRKVQGSGVQGVRGSGGSGLKNTWPHVEREADVVKDPVCGMMIDEKTAAATSQYKGRTYYFCAAVCKERFDRSPQSYADKD